MKKQRKASSVLHTSLLHGFTSSFVQLSKQIHALYLFLIIAKRADTGIWNVAKRYSWAGFGPNQEVKLSANR